MTADGVMSGVVVYCITGPGGASPDAGPELAGLGGRPVVVRESGGVALWTEAMEQPLESTPEAILAHQAVVERAWRTRTACLPLRYGQWFASPDDAIAAVEERLDSLMEALERVRDAVEYELRVEFREPEDPPSAPAEKGPIPGGTDGAGGQVQARTARSRGRAYMEMLRLRQARAREADRLREEVLGALEEVVQDLVMDRRPASHPDGCSVAHLLARSAEERYVERLRTVQRPNPDMHVRLKGPWPPWSFGA